MILGEKKKPVLRARPTQILHLVYCFFFLLFYFILFYLFIYLFMFLFIFIFFLQKRKKNNYDDDHLDTLFM